MAFENGCVLVTWLAQAVRVTDRVHQLEQIVDREGVMMRDPKRGTDIAPGVGRGPCAAAGARADLGLAAVVGGGVGRFKSRNTVGPAGRSRTESGGVLKPERVGEVNVPLHLVGPLPRRRRERHYGAGQ
jgi:hypothetical protein